MTTWPLLFNTIRKHSTHNAFGMVRVQNDGKHRPHQGWDLQAATGIPVHAIGAGRVVFTKEHGDYGLQLCHSFNFKGQVLYAFYAHLVAIRVTVHQAVRPGEVIALSGRSGNARTLAMDESHLHFEVRERPYLGLGLEGRVSPERIYGYCPLYGSALGR